MFSRSGETGRHAVFRAQCSYECVGSNPTFGIFLSYVPHYQSLARLGSRRTFSTAAEEVTLVVLVSGHQVSSAAPLEILLDYNRGHWNAFGEYKISLGKIGVWVILVYESN